MNDEVVTGADPGEGQRVLSVADFNRRVAKLLERSVPLVWVAGEVSNLVRAASGHWYFSLKDADAQVRCVMFRTANRLVDWAIANGQAVEVRALAGLYAPRGDFQLTVESIRRAGAGALYEAFLRIKEKLAQEGLLDAARKRPLPTFPRAVGIVTSLQAAALRDVLSTLARRAAHVRVIVYPSPVQGRDAPARLIEAIDTASQRASALGEIDVLLIVRGGGSMEDLWAFNDEGVARAIARVSVPVVSGVGHETDVTIADFVAHVRAATPTAAAELVSPDGPRLKRRVADQAEALRRVLERQLAAAEQRLDDVQRRLRSPLQRLAEREARLAELHLRLASRMSAALDARALRLRATRHLLLSRKPDTRSGDARLQQAWLGLSQNMRRQLALKRSALAIQAGRLEALNPGSALRRGYAIVEDSGGRIVDDARKLRVDERIRVRFARGELAAEVRTIRDDPSAS